MLGSTAWRSVSRATSVTRPMNVEHTVACRCLHCTAVDIRASKQIRTTTLTFESQTTPAMTLSLTRDILFATFARLPVSVAVLPAVSDGHDPAASTRMHRVWSRDDHANGIPMGMGIGDNIGNGNGKEWETTCMGMGMAIIPMGINSHRRIQC